MAFGGIGRALGGAAKGMARAPQKTMMPRQGPPMAGSSPGLGPSQTAMQGMGALGGALGQRVPPTTPQPIQSASMPPPSPDQGPQVPQMGMNQSGMARPMPVGPPMMGSDQMGQGPGGMPNYNPAGNQMPPQAKADMMRQMMMQRNQGPQPGIGPSFMQRPQGIRNDPANEAQRQQMIQSQRAQRGYM